MTATQPHNPNNLGPGGKKQETAAEAASCQKSLFAVHGLRVRARERLLLDIDHFSMYPQERVGLTGSSGAGKSTFALALMGLAEEKGLFVSGHFLFQELWLAPNRQAQSWEKLRRTQISWIAQDPASALDPLRTVKKTLALSQRHTQKDPRKDPQAHRLISTLGLEPLLKKYPHQLSGGEGQRVLIAMALMARPALVIADEPTASLDAVCARQVLELLFEVTQEQALLLITHDPYATGQVDRHVVMRQGRLFSAKAESGLMPD